MGNCCASQSEGVSETNNLNKQKLQRQSNWAATGTVALRDSKLKVRRWRFEYARGSLEISRVLLLQALPSAALQLGPAARVLDATNNQLTYLPDQISHFSNLQRLILASNQLNCLPPCLTQLVSLKVSGGVLTQQRALTTLVMLAAIAVVPVCRCLC